MSSGVSDQMKVPGNTAKNVEERNIPWSQQVDEAASYENLASPINEDNSSGTLGDEILGEINRERGDSLGGSSKKRKAKVGKGKKKAAKKRKFH